MTRLSVVGRTKPERSRQDAVKILEAWLERVKSGEIVELAIAGITHDQFSMWDVTTSSNRVLLNGSVAQLLFELQSRLSKD